MSRDLLLGIDLGTTSTKAVVIDTVGRVLGDASRPATLLSPQAAWAEEDPEEWWSNACALIPECCDRAGVCAGEIAAVGVSGMVPAVVLTDGHGRAGRLSIQQNDARAVAEIAQQR
ncbi:MAG: FGGY family carbohydrate kinase, partial [Armatimonadota bacterium]|nr:FGGY family carbohydrate kinase [Armatimonadota bacterium]